MKLANALSLRSELQTRIRQLESRLDNNALVQEGESPAEDPMELLRELEEDYAQLEELIARINRTNSTTEAGEGRTLSDLLARRECMTGRLRILRDFLNSASAVVNRRTVGEIRIRSAVNVREAGGPGCQGTPGAGRDHSGEKLDHRAGGAVKKSCREGEERPLPALWQRGKRASSSQCRSHWAHRFGNERGHSLGSTPNL